VFLSLIGVCICGVLSFSLSGEKDLMPVFITKLTFTHAAHLGSVDTIVGPSKTTSHVENTMEERSALGLPENMIRWSVGIENINDIKINFLQALESL
jgi:cystathionine gamma-synthase